MGNQSFANQRLGLQISAGTGLFSRGSLVLSNSNGISFGVANSASSLVITATVAGNQISAGAASVSNGTIVFSNSNNITFGMIGSTVTAQTVGTYSLVQGPFPNAQGGIGVSSVTAYVQRIMIPFYFNATSLGILGSCVTILGAPPNLTINFGVYTMTGSTASLVTSASTTGQAPFGGLGIYPIGTISFTPGEYLLYVHMTGTAATGYSYSGYTGNIQATSTIDWFDNGFVTNTTPPVSFHVSEVLYSNASNYPTFKLIGS